MWLNRDFSRFWQFIENKFSNFAEGRSFIRNEFVPLLEFLENGSKTPSDQTVTDVLKRFNAEIVQIVWVNTLDRRIAYPDEAVTAARTLQQTVCKHILVDIGIENTNKTDLPHRYHLVNQYYVFYE